MTPEGKPDALDILGGYTTVIRDPVAGTATNISVDAQGNVKILGTLVTDEHANGMDSMMGGL